MKMVGVRAAAAAAGQKRYFTGIPCPKGHVAERFTVGGQCVECNHERARAWQLANPEKISKRWAEYHAENRDHLCARKRSYEEKNRDEVRAKKRAYMQANQSRMARKLKRCTPACLTADDHKAMDAMYADARQRSLGGAPHEVDHIVPINGKGVCGLHVPWNLQVLTQFANRSKGNRLEADPPQ